MDLGAILSRFEKWRLPEVRAAVTMCHQRMVIDTASTKLTKGLVALQKFKGILSKKLPAIFPPPVFT